MAEDIVKKRGPGRPPNARNKTSMAKGQQLLDSNAEEFARLVIALAANNKDDLNSSCDVPYTVRLAAIKLGLDKTIANEKEKIDDEKTVTKAIGGAIEESMPQVFMSAVK